MTLKHVIGPGTPHRYHPDSKVEIDRHPRRASPRRAAIRYPRKIRFTTWTLAYNEMKWVTIDGLDEHWERARVDAEIVNDATMQVKTDQRDCLHAEVRTCRSAVRAGRASRS